ncbi:MAG: uncharacterized protein KVP18_000913 [Porospora cf. gigantea A]|uniref:uncharacterized protein n=3 Tax=Porospora cf. gigantea A TaxID=2853593 RepID=UPI00355A6D89|nr:MAG: hypothetical protein KVP18_000913 [Porospora cf. gigantea A]
MQSRNRYISERLLDAALAAMYQENLQPLALSSLQCVAGDAQYFLGNFESANELYRQGFETAPQVQIAEKYLLRGVFNAEEVSAAAALVSLPHRVADAGRWVSLPVSEFQSTLAEVENLDAPYIDHLVLYLWETANFRRLRLFVEYLLAAGRSTAMSLEVMLVLELHPPNKEKLTQILDSLDASGFTGPQCSLVRSGISAFLDGDVTEATQFLHKAHQMQYHVSPFPAVLLLQCMTELARHWAATDSEAYDVVETIKDSSHLQQKLQTAHTKFKCVFRHLTSLYPGLSAPYRYLLDFLREEQYSLLRLRIQLVQDVTNFDPQVDSTRVARIALFLQPMLHSLDHGILGLKNEICFATKLLRVKQPDARNVAVCASLFKLHHLSNLGEVESAFFGLQSTLAHLKEAEPEAILALEFLLISADILSETEVEEGPQLSTLLAHSLEIFEGCYPPIVTELVQAVMRMETLPAGQFFFFSQGQIQAISTALMMHLGFLNHSGEAVSPVPTPKCTTCTAWAHRKISCMQTKN